MLFKFYRTVMTKMVSSKRLSSLGMFLRYTGVIPVNWLQIAGKQDYMLRV